MIDRATTVTIHNETRTMWGWRGRGGPGRTIRALSRAGRSGWREQGSGRTLILVAAIGSVLYSLAVLVTVGTTGDIGLRCVFGRRVFDVNPAAVWSTDPRERPTDLRLRAPQDSTDRFSRVAPEPGDYLLHLGSWPIANYHQYVEARRGIRDKVGQSVEVRWKDARGVDYRGLVRVRTPPLSSYVWSLVWFLQEIVVFAIGARVYWRRPRDESARIFFWLCVVTVVAFMGGYHWPQIVVSPPLIYLFALSAVFVPILSLHFYLVFPRVNPYFALNYRRVLVVLYGLPLLAVGAIWGSMFWAGRDPDPERVATALQVLQSVSLGYVRISVGILVLCLACLIDSFLRARSRWERNQVRWILLASLLSMFPIAYLMWDTWNAPHRLGLSGSVWPMFIVSLLYTAAYAVSITRYKLMRAEEYLNRGVLYILVTVSAGLLYSGVLVVVTLAIGDRLLTDRTSLGAMVAGVTAIVVLLLSEMARHGFQKVLDRQFFREKYNFDQAMRRMSQVVGSMVDRATLGRRLLEAAADVLRVEWGAIYVLDPATDGAMVLAACHGPEPDDRTLAASNPLVARLRTRPGPFRVPHGLGAVSDASADAMIRLGGEVAAGLNAEGTLAGLLVLGPKRNGMPYEEEEIAFLGALGSVSTLALRSAEIQATLASLNQELREKVEKIAEQRRRIVVLQDQLARRVPVDELEMVDRPALPATAPGERDAFDAIKGTSRAVRRMVEVARKVAASPSAVLIRGESGTGKELLAEAIHRASPRADRPFIKVHCAALSQNLLESELFGHVKGAFTGADRDRVGRFQQADGGTLFLDEIGDINWEVQTKLLRVLQEMAFERVGSSQTLTVDVRILAATHQDLEGLIRSGKFREDLYYRLNVISLRAPSLRERREDIFELALHFLDEHGRRAGKVVSQLDEAVVEVLSGYDWPGNVRELENAIERAVVLADGPAVTIEDLPADVRRLTRRRRARAPLPAPTATLALARPEGTDRGLPALEAERADAEMEEDLEVDPEFAAYEKRRLLDALREADGNKSLAARLLAMPRSTFFSKLKKHGLA